MINVFMVFVLYTGIGLLLNHGVNVLLAKCSSGFQEQSSNLSPINFLENWQKNLGESFFLGVLLVVLINNLAQLFKWNLNQSHFFYIVLTVSVIVFCACFYRLFKKSFFRFDLSRLKDSQNYFHIFAIALLLLHFVLIVQQNQLLPLTPWDAWSGWVAKSKIWHFEGLSQLIVNDPFWFRIDGSMVNQTAHYPDGLSLLYAFHSGFWGWNETPLNAVYPAMYVAFLLAFYGTLKSLTNSRSAIIATLLLGTIPFVNTHIVLAGYADIWVAVFLAFAVFNVHLYQKYKRANHLVIAILFMLLMLLFKLESIIWFLIVLFSILFSRLTKSNKLLALIVVILALITWFFLGGVTVETQLGELALTPDYLAIPGLGKFALVYINTLPAWFEAVFFSRNWNLLWYSIPVLIWAYLKANRMNAHRLNHSNHLQMYSVFFICALIFLFLLFNYTYASRFANSFTSINRVFLHVVPLYVGFLTLSLHQAFESHKQN